MNLVNLNTGTGKLKAGFLGFAGSGKTFTACKLALAVRKHFGMKDPIAMHDTEGGAQYVAGMVKAATGQDMVGIQSRSLGDATNFLRECAKGGISVAIVDSVTHLWREVCDSYLKAVNKARIEKGLGQRKKLEFQDWGPIKAEWAVFTDLFLNSDLHIIICGRAGYDWDFEQISDEGKKELVKTGVKMKTESEFGYEPSLLVEMERIQVREDKQLTKNFVHRATVIKCRYNALDGQGFDDPTGETFAPHYTLLSPGVSAASVDTTTKTHMDVDEKGDNEWQRERKMRAIFCEEIEGALVAEFPSKSGSDNLAKVEIINKVFGTRSWTAVESTGSSKLKAGLDALPVAIREYKEQSDAAEKLAAELPVSNKKGQKQNGGAK